MLSVRLRLSIDGRLSWTSKEENKMLTKLEPEEIVREVPQFEKQAYS